jgi:hypothetical protein
MQIVYKRIEQWKEFRFDYNAPKYVNYAGLANNRGSFSGIDFGRAKEEE